MPISGRLAGECCTGHDLLDRLGQVLDHVRSRVRQHGAHIDSVSIWREAPQKTETDPTGGVSDAQTGPPGQLVQRGLQQLFQDLGHRLLLVHVPSPASATRT